MYTISKTFSFDAAHQLLGLPADHPCTRLHGHTYYITLEIEAEDTDEIGMVEDYRKLAPVKEFIDSVLDHKNLNDVLPCNPTAENIAGWVYHEFVKLLYPLWSESQCELKAVTVQETPKTSARYEPRR